MWTNCWTKDNCVVSRIIKTTLSPTSKTKPDCIKANWIFSGTGLPRILSKISRTSCPPSRRGNGNELRTARFIETNAEKRTRPEPPCSESWAPISTILTGPLNCWAVEEKLVIKLL